MKIKIVSLLCFIFSFSSCNSWLDIELANKVDEGKLFKSEQGFYEALAGIYSQMAGTSLYGGTLTYEYMDIYGQYYSYNSNRYEKHFSYAYNLAEVKNIHAAIWKNLYNCITGANNILLWADKNASVLSENSLNQVKGEALAMRAFLHFDLYRMFSPDVKRDPKAKGIPYNKVFGVSLPPIYTVEEVTQLILNDLFEAEKLLANDAIVNVVPYQIESVNKDAADKYVARFNLYGVKAMIARLYQARGQNEEAIKYAKEVIESEKFRLLDFSSVNQDEKLTDILFSDEHIFSLRNKKIAEVTHKLYYAIEKDGVTTLASLPFNETSSKYEGNSEDMRYAKWFNVGEFKKFELKNTDRFYGKMPMIKLSEMYLIIAECSYTSAPEVSLQYINTLRKHRVANSVAWSFLTKKYIIEEMVREYLGEGQMWYAYKRNNLPVIDMSNGKEIPASNNLFVFPYPDKELETGGRN